MTIGRILLVLAFTMGVVLSSCQTEGPDTEALRFFKRANLLLNQREYRRAIPLYTEAIMKDSAFFEAYSNRGIAYFESSNEKEALQDYGKALALNDSFVPAHQNRMRLFMEQGRFAEALNDADFLVKVYPDSAALLNVRAILYQQEGLRELALNDLDRAIALEPKAEYLVNRGYIHYLDYDYPSASKDLGRALGMDAYLTQALNNQALVLADMGRYDEAEKLISKALALEKNDPLLLNNRAYILIRAGKFALGKGILDELNGKLKENSWYLRNMAMYQVAEGSADSAVRLLTMAMVARPDLEHGQYMMAKAQLKAGNRQEACDHLAKARELGDPFAMNDSTIMCR